MIPREPEHSKRQLKKEKWEEQRIEKLQGISKIDPCEEVGDARQKIWIKTLKETNLGLAWDCLTSTRNHFDTDRLHSDLIIVFQRLLTASSMLKKTISLQVKGRDDSFNEGSWSHTIQTGKKCYISTIPGEGSWVCWGGKITIHMQVPWVPKFE